MKKVILSVATLLLMVTQVSAQIEVNQQGRILLGDHEQGHSYAEIEPSGRFIMNAEVSDSKKTTPLIRFIQSISQSRPNYEGLNLMNLSPGLRSSSLNYLVPSSNLEKTIASLVSSLDSEADINNSRFSLHTLKSGFFTPRITVQPNSIFFSGGLFPLTSNSNDVAIHIAIGYTGVNNLQDRGLIIDNSGLGQPTIRPYNNQYGCLGPNSYSWNKLYVKEIRA
ncbi:hypothetical protein [Porphyromonas loveana]|uniref:hypothetical protein n=1 Tax=Porphyromonas loveana TaxID=1884669 RepID=UPI0035A184D0